MWTSPIVSYHGYKYHVIFVGHFTCYTWFYHLKQKSVIHDIYNLFKALVEKHFQSPIITFYIDNGSAYISLQSFLATNGIFHLTTPPYTPKYNGFSERYHCHIVELTSPYFTVPICL